MDFLEIDRVTKRFGNVEAVKQLSLSIDEGEIIALLGPSGCGKTTLLRCIAGLESLTEGEIRLLGRDISPTPPYRRDFGMMFQAFALFPHLNVAQNIRFGLKNRDLSRDEMEARTAEMLELVDLVGYADRSIDQLSGGQQQRVALARSLATRPRLLLLDEPLGALDRTLRDRLMLDLRQILKSVGVTTLTVTHDQAEGFALADRIAIMNQGEIEQIGPPQAVYRKPKNSFVARFLGFQNLIDRREWDQSPGTILIKPSACLHQFTEGGIPLQGSITRTVFRGRFVQVWLNSRFGTLVFELDEAPPVDQTEWWLDPAEVLVLD